MGGGGSISAMNASIKNNDRRKPKVKPFPNYVKTYKKRAPLRIKKVPRIVKRNIKRRLKDQRDHEDFATVLKLFFSFCLTIAAIGGIVYLIMLIFFN